MNRLLRLLVPALILAPIVITIGLILLVPPVNVVTVSPDVLTVTPDDLAIQSVQKLHTLPRITPVLTVTPAALTVKTPVLTVVPAIVETTGLRIRACASHTCRTVGWLRQGDTVQVAGCQSGWAYLPHLSGWSRSIYLSPDPCNNK